jgi:hypothetical protein
MSGEGLREPPLSIATSAPPAGTASTSSSTAASSPSRSSRANCTETPARSFLGSVCAARKRLRFELRWLHEANERLVPARWIHVIRSRS